MKNQKKIPTLNGIIMITISIVVLFGGVFVYQHYFGNPNLKIINPISPNINWTIYTNDQLMSMYDKDWRNKPLFFKGIEKNYLIIDEGTAPPPRGLIIFDLSAKKEVFSGRYSTPLNITSATITYWNPTTQKVTTQNCPESSKWISEGLGAEIESHVYFDLATLTIKSLGETRCSATQ